MKFNVDSEFYCTCCGNKGISIPRFDRSQRPAGHLKKMYCLFCREEHNFVECKPYTHYCYDEFLLEFNNNNFNDDGTRKMPFGLFKDKLKKEGII